nr:ribonuclease H-like domain-containing protein [Tanacetum cinerariifolium]
MHAWINVEAIPRVEAKYTPRLPFAAFSDDSLFLIVRSTSKSIDFAKRLKKLEMSLEKALNGAKTAPGINILDFYEEHYEDILPVMDKIRHDKRREVHIRLDFEENSKKSQRMREDSQNSSAKTLSARYRKPSERPRMRDHLRNNDGNVFGRLGHQRESAFKRLSDAYSPSATKSGPDREYSRDDSYSRGLPYKRNSSTSRDRPQSSGHSHGVEESYGDPEDHVKIFQAATHVERWAKPTWCHMFNSTLIGSAKVWFDELPPESIDGYTDLKAAFLAYFMQQKKYVKDPVEIHNIKQKDGEPIEEFIERFKIETGQTAFASKKKVHTPWKSQDQSKRQNSERRPDFKNQPKDGRGSNKFTLLTRMPKEIFTAESGKFKPPPPMVTPVKKRSNSKFCEFYNDKGHSTDECVQLRKQIEELLRAGKLSHFIKEIRMTQSFAHVKEITFPPLDSNKGTGGPLVIEAEISGHAVHQIYVDGGSSMERNGINKSTNRTVHTLEKKLRYIRMAAVRQDRSIAIDFRAPTQHPRRIFTRHTEETWAGLRARQSDPSRSTETGRGRDSMRNILPQLVIQPGHGDYEMWKLRKEQYFQVQDYALWDVIENGNSFNPIPRTTTNADGTSTSTISGPVTIEEKAQKKNDVKARSMLLMALPSEHLLTLNQYKDAKTLFKAIQVRFSGNDATKKTPNTLLKQIYENFNVPSTKSLDSIFNRLQKIVSQNKADLDTMSIDDLYNNFKIIEQEVKRTVTSSSSLGSLNMAILSSPSSTNEVDTANIQVSTVSTPVSTVIAHDNTANLSDATVYAFLANQPNGSQLVYEDLEQIHEDDLEEMDLKWQLALLSIRARMYFQRTGKKSTINESDNASYMADDEVPTNMALVAFSDSEAINDESNLWHKRLGHIIFKTMNKLVKGNLVRGLPLKIFENDHTCVACQKGKQHKASCKSKLVNSVSQPLQILHMNLFGPTFIKSIMGKIYCLVVIDDYNRFSWVFFLAKKDETSGILKNFITGIENQLNHKVKIIRCDNGTEFKNYEMNQFCGIKGIKREFSNAMTPQQNRVAERNNRTLIEAGRTMLADSLLPIPFWDDAVNTGCYVQNRVLVTKPHNKTPYELLIGRTPIISFMRPFGCLVTILNTLDHLGKFDGKADEGFLVGYSINSKAFRVYNSRTRKINSDAGQAGKEKVPDQEYILLPLMNTCSDVPLSHKEVDSSLKDNADKNSTGEPTCVEGGKTDDLGSLDQQMKSTDDSENTNSINSFDTASLTVNSASNKDGTFQRIIGERDFSTPITVNVASSSFSPPAALDDFSKMPNLEDTGIFDDAYNDRDKGAEADYNDFEAVISVNPIPSTRIHNDHSKEQIIGQGHKQEEGIDYDEVFAHVARIKAIRLFLAYASFMDFTVYQMDVKSAFLYCTIEDEVYVSQPPGFMDPEFPYRVYKVEKDLYGLHHTPRAFLVPSANEITWDCQGGNPFGRIGINEADFDPEEEIRLVERLFDSLMEEIDIFLAPDDSIPLGIENDDYDTEEDIFFLEELLSNDSPSLPENESFHFDIPLG